MASALLPLTKKPKDTMKGVFGCVTRNEFPPCFWP